MKYTENNHFNTFILEILIFVARAWRQNTNKNMSLSKQRPTAQTINTPQKTKKAIEKTEVDKKPVNTGKSRKFVANREYARPEIV